MNKKITILAILMVVISGLSFGQLIQPTKFKVALSKKEVKVGEQLDIVFKAKIDDSWHVYSNDFDPNLGPVLISFKFNPDNSYELKGKTRPINAKKHFDKTWNGEVSFFEKTAELRQTVVVKSLPLNISGSFDYQSCSDETGQCVLGDDEFDLNIGGKKAAVAPVDKNTKKGEKKKEESLMYIFWIAFLGGLAAIFTPCVFPMIPMTVSFFMHSDENKAKAKFKAFFYGFSIIAIYTVIGTVVAVTLGANFANFLSTHWIPNLLFFVIFMVFAASFFGMFEITMPSWIVNKSVSNEDKGGLMGAFFMAFTLVLVSFSCTGPIVGAILVASAGGAVLMPIVGMLGFSLAFALPFTLFAIFPSWMNSLPKSGGWLNSVKVVLGFIEVALGLKFLSIADQTYHWGILDREIYLAIWIVVFTLMGLYLLGKLKFAHDSDIKYISVPRLFLGIATLSFVVYMIPGMWGAPLKGLSGYLPPQNSIDFDITEIVRNNSGTVERREAKPVKYSEYLHLPHGIHGYFDLQEGLEASKRENKPIFIDFTGHGCVNCRQMESNVWSDPQVLKRLKEDYIVVALYVDDKTKLPKEEWIVSTYDGKKKKTLGKKNSDYQITRYNVNAQPYYCLLNSSGKDISMPKAYDLNVDNFIKFLDEGIKNYKAGKTVNVLNK